MDIIEINGEKLPEPKTYSVKTEDVLRDSSGEKESGKSQRDVARKDVYTVSAEFDVTKNWLKKLKQYKSMDKLSVRFFDPSSGEMEEHEMWADFSATLSHATSYGGIWQVQMTLKEF